MKDFNDLLKQLHEQYAENVNSWNSIFVSLLGALFALFGTYGFFYANVYLHVSKGDSDSIYTMENILLLAEFVCFVLAALSVLVLILGYKQRRDHAIIGRIRERFGCECVREQIFGKLYKADDKGWFTFLPDFYNLFYP